MTRSAGTAVTAAVIDAKTPRLIIVAISARNVSCPIDIARNPISAASVVVDIGKMTLENVSIRAFSEEPISLNS